jgi:S-adenosylmethionine:tRNA ribosyltransferase-isomerase
MALSDYWYDLPDELIAQQPLADRSASRMLVIDRAAQTLRDQEFADLPSLIRPGDVLVVNNSKVFPARLYGVTDTGANVEILLAKDLGNSRWQVLARPEKRLRSGKRIVFAEGLSAEVIDHADGVGIIIKFENDGDLERRIDEIGQMPLPPYIKRPRTGSTDDRQRYQTVYAEARGSIAAPTAGLHFTDEMLEKVRQAGAEIESVTLHVGYGTFEPVRADDLKDHRVLPEEFSISGETADRLNAAKAEGRRVIAVGTTTTRSLEGNFAKHGRFKAETGTCYLTITPGYKFHAIDALLTNFHLPESSLLILVSTFAGREFIMKAYEHAVAARYRFYSYGDCMFII